MYKNKLKSTAREKIWEHTINTLTTNRNYSTVVTEKDIYSYWELIKYDLKKHGILDLENQEKIRQNFLDYRNSIIQPKASQNLQVLLFCGPEPENDIELLLKLGVLEENIWAVELDKTSYISAINILKHAYPGVKLFKTKIDNLFDVIKTKFDIVYLDFTASFFSKSQKTYKTTIELFKNNIVKDLGILITNYSEINPSDSTFDNDVKTITEYFNYQSFVHELLEEDGTFIELPYMNEKNFDETIRRKHKDAYSSFLTHFHIYLSEIITPAINIFSNKAIKNLLFEEKELKLFLTKMNSFSMTDDEGSFEYEGKFTEPESFWFEYFVENIKTINPSFYGYLKTNDIDSYIGLINILKDSHFNNNLFNKETLEYLIQTQKNLIDPKGRLFCDVPMLHLWVHLIINQLGSPYHINLKNHLRFRYTGKEREMFVDVYTLDKCRYFYDWLSSYTTLPENMLNVAKQLIVRINIDIIRKQHQFYLIDESYRYGNLVCYNDDGAIFLKELYLNKREYLTSSDSKNGKDEFEQMFELADYLASKVEENYCQSFKSFIKFHMTYTAHSVTYLKVKDVPEKFKVFGQRFKKSKIGENYNFEYNSSSKSLRYRSKCLLNGSHNMDLMIYKTIKSVFDRYGFVCELFDKLD